MEEWYNMNLLTVENVMDMFQVSRTTVYRWREQGLSYVNVGNLVRFKEEDINKFISININSNNKNMFTAFTGAKVSYFNKSCQIEAYNKGRFSIFADMSKVKGIGNIILTGSGKSSMSGTIGDRLYIDFSPVVKDQTKLPIDIMAYLLDPDETKKMCGEVNSSNNIIEVDSDKYFRYSYDSFYAFSRDKEPFYPWYINTCKEWLNGKPIIFLLIPWYDSFKLRLEKTQHYLKNLDAASIAKFEGITYKWGPNEVLEFESHLKIKEDRSINFTGNEILIDFGQCSGLNTENIIECMSKMFSGYIKKPMGYLELNYSIYEELEELHDSDGWLELDKGIFIKIIIKEKKTIINKLTNNCYDDIVTQLRIEPNHAQRVIRIYKVDVVESYRDMTNPRLLYSYPWDNETSIK